MKTRLHSPSPLVLRLWARDLYSVVLLLITSQVTIKEHPGPSPSANVRIWPCPRQPEAMPALVLSLCICSQETPPFGVKGSDVGKLSLRC